MDSNVSDAELSIEGYDLFRCDRPGGHKGVGVLLYVNEGLKAVKAEVEVF